MPRETVLVVRFCTDRQTDTHTMLRRLELVLRGVVVCKVTRGICEALCLGVCEVKRVSGFEGHTIRRESPISRIVIDPLLSDLQTFVHAHGHVGAHSLGDEPLASWQLLIAAGHRATGCPTSVHAVVLSGVAVKHLKYPRASLARPLLRTRTTQHQSSTGPALADFRLSGSRRTDNI